jgi:hypothetical protein
MTNFTFTNKAEYLAYRANFKERYFEAVKAIRDHKIKSKELQREGEYSMNAFYTLQNLRTEINDLVLELAEARQLSAAQRLANTIK